MITINKMEEMQKYYDANSNTYVFNDDVRFDCDIAVFSNIYALNIKARYLGARDINAWDVNALNIKACYLGAIVINAWDVNALDITARNITAHNIDAQDINARDINAWDVNARNIDARDINAYNITAHAISYYAVCVAYHNITCKSIKGRRANCRHFVLDGEIKLKDLSEETEAPDVPREPEKASFEEGKYYVFSAKKYDDTVRLSALKHSADNWTWGLDGLIVDVKDEGTGYINNFLIVPEWCEELKREGN